MADSDIDRVRKEIENTKQVIHDLHNLQHGVVMDPLLSTLREVSGVESTIMHYIHPSSTSCTFGLLPLGMHVPVLYIPYGWKFSRDPIKSAKEKPKHAHILNS